MTDHQAPTRHNIHPTTPTTGVRPNRRAPYSTPRWVKVLVLFVIVLILLFAILHLTGGIPWSHLPS